jgi:predicted Zn-dependent protease
MPPDSSSAAVTPENIYIRVALDRLREAPDDPDALLVVGSWLLLSGKPERALEYLHRVTQMEPKYPGIWRVKAKAFDALGDPANAEACRRRGSDRFS